MPEKKWFDKYDNQSADELIRLKSDFRIDSLLSAFEQAVQSKEVNQGAQSLSEPERVILAVEALSREVNNGGFSQFFYNSSFEYADFIVRALMLIRCPEMAKMAQKAIEIVGLPTGSSQEDYQNRIADDDELSDQLEPLDDKFFDNEEDVEARLFEFIEQNSGQICIVRKANGEKHGI